MKTQQTNKLLFLLIVLTKLSFSQFLITDSLKANYSFAGNPLDESGRNNHGTLISNPTLTTDRFGNSNCAYQFYGDTNNYIKVNYSPDFDIPDYKSFTISLWYQGGSANEFDGETIFCKRKSTRTNWYQNDYDIGQFDGNQVYAFNGFLFVASSTSLNDWNHLVVTYLDGIINLYRNDTLRASTQFANFVVTQSLGEIAIGFKFTGKIDDVRFYNRNIGVDEIHELFILPSSCNSTTTIKENNTTENLSIYPNPTNDYFTIELQTNEVQTLEVFDVTGRLVNTQTIEDKKTVINVCNLDAGLYNMSIKTNNGNINKKLIIVK